MVSKVKNSKSKKNGKKKKTEEGRRFQPQFASDRKAVNILVNYYISKTERITIRKSTKYYAARPRERKKHPVCEFRRAIT